MRIVHIGTTTTKKKKGEKKLTNKLNYNLWWSKYRSCWNFVSNTPEPEITTYNYMAAIFKFRTVSHKISDFNFNLILKTYG